MANCFLSLGSNMGDRFMYLSEAQDKISQRCGAVLQCSSLYETDAWGNMDQPPFLNQVLKLETSLSALECLEQCQQIEQEALRSRLEKWGRRTLDIDLLYYDDMQCTTPALTLPHPYLQDRNFVLVPLTEIAPDLVHPVLGKTSTALLAQCPDVLPVRKLVLS